MKLGGGKGRRFEGVRSRKEENGRQKGSGRSLQDREPAVESDWWRGGASGSQSPAEKRWAFLGTLDSPSSPSSSADYQFFLPFLPKSTRIYPHSTPLTQEILSTFI